MQMSNADKPYTTPTPSISAGFRGSGYLFGADRDEVAKRLAAENIYVRKYFYPLTSDYQCYRELLPHVDTPVADHIAASVITLPLSPSMEIEDAVRICELIKTCRR